MKVGIVSLPEELELTISQSAGHAVVVVEVGGKRQGKLYIHRHGITIAPDNTQRKNGKLIMWRELTVQSDQTDE